MRVLTTFVTALKYIKLSSDSNSLTTFLFAGIGNRVHIYRETNESHLTVVDALPAGETIHGFSKAGNNRIITHGGRFVAILDVKLEHESFKCSVVSVHEFDDWVLGTTWFQGTNSIMISCGHSTIFQCDETSLNVRNCFQSVEKELTWSTTLYQSDDQSTIRAAAGTSFGDVLFWAVPNLNLEESSAEKNDNQLNSTTKSCSPVHRVGGHDGPVTQIKVNDDRSQMVSASVDRTLRIWKVRELGKCETCNDNGCFIPVLTHYGHLARIWDVSFFPNFPSAVVSVAEDRTCRVWSMTKQNHQLANFHGHAGRNVWCIDVLTTGKTVSIATGGEDGSIKIRSLSISIFDETNSAIDATDMKKDSNQHTSYKTWKVELPDQFANPRKSGGSNKECARSLVIPENGKVLISTDYGRILSLTQSTTCFIHQSEIEKSLKWDELYRDPYGLAYTPSSLAHTTEFIFAGQSNGNVTVMHARLGNDCEWRKVSDIPVFLNNSSIVMGLFAFPKPDGSGTFLFASSERGELWHWEISHPNEETYLRYCTTYRQRKLVKTALVTCVHVLNDKGIILAGDRGGRLLAYKCPDANDFTDYESEMISEVISFPLGACRPHSDRVSTILPSSSIYDQKVSQNGTINQSVELTTASFDGRMANIQVTLQSKGTDSQIEFQVLQVLKSVERIETISKLIFPNVPHTTIDNKTNFESNSRTCLVGFRSAELLIWDVDRRNELLRVNCGNWRRANDIYLNVHVGKSVSSALIVASMMVVYWRSGYVHIVRTLPPSNWNISSSEIEEAYVQTLGTCFHGQRANALQRIGKSPFILTAGEDTIIHVSHIDGKQWVTGQRLEKHISGVNDISVKASLIDNTRYIAASGGGCDEVVIWAGKSASGPWRPVCCTKIGEILQERIGQRYAKHRVMCVVVVNVDFENIEQALIVIGRSDGSVINIKATPREESSLSIQDEWKIRIAKPGNRKHIGAVNCITNVKKYILSGDTRGYIGIWEILNDDILNYKDEWINHDGGVNCISGWCINEKKMIIASGGDDERIVLNIWYTNEKNLNREEWKCEIGAHTAAVTGIKIAEIDEYIFMVSTGCDQRVRLWKIELENEKFISCILWTTVISNVSDVSGIWFDICYEDENDEYVLNTIICGCGLDKFEKRYSKTTMFEYTNDICTKSMKKVISNENE